MTEALLFTLRLAAILGSGLMAGLFFAFSFAVMGGLARIQPAEGIAAMQSINRVILNPVFLTVFLATPAACALVLLSALWKWQDPGAAWLLLGAASYILGTFLVTIILNVPLNNTLAAVQPASTEGAGVWTRYLSDWVAWNHVRTATSFAAMALLTVGLYLEARGPGRGLNSPRSAATTSRSMWPVSTTSLRQGRSLHPVGYMDGRADSWWKEPAETRHL